MKNKKTKKEDKKMENAPLNEPANKKDPAQTYWDRVADDVASGYKSSEDENEVLNRNQHLPRQNERK